MNEDPIPYGFCHCGCGETTPISPRSSRNRGLIRGEPIRFIHGHNGRAGCAHSSQAGVKAEPWGPNLWTVEDRGFITPCWIWRRSLSRKGYGWRKYRGRNTGAHRIAWIEAGREIPSGLQLDHLCRQRACVNPDHLELVTLTENVRRGANTKLSPDDVRRIRAAAADGEPKLHIARRFGVADATVHDIVHLRSWRDISG